MPNYRTEEQRYEAVRTRDYAADDVFFYAVVTTGIYCYPSCPSKASLKDNTRYFDTRQAAVHAGFRPCKRCASDQEPLLVRQRKLVESACEIIIATTGSTKINHVADELSVSRYHLHKLFKQFLGISPKAFANSVRSRALENSLGNTATVTQAVYDIDYKQSSTFYASGAKRLGMSPKKFQRGGKDLSIRYAFAKTRMGKIIVATTDKGVCCILFGDSQRAMEQDLADRFNQATLSRDDTGMEDLLSSVVDSIENPSHKFSFPLDIQGTAFQEIVWKALQTIQPGNTASYQDIAKQIDKPKAFRAVAAACAANPLAVVVPCHRVVRATGEISGYRWGVNRKRKLLESEKTPNKEE